MGTGRTDEFRKEAVRIALTSGLSPRQVAGNLGVGFSTLNKWVSAHRETDVISAEDRDLARENERLRREVRILKEETLTVVIPLRIKLRGGRKSMITNGIMALEARQDITLIKAVARAFRWRGMLEAGAFATINELAAAAKINPS
jgi:transposase